MKKLLFTTAIGAGFLLGCKKEEEVKQQHVECTGVVYENVAGSRPVMLYASFNINDGMVASAVSMGNELNGDFLTSINKFITVDMKHGSIQYKIQLYVHNMFSTPEQTVYSLTCDLA